MRVACIQFEPAFGEVEKNLAEMESRIRAAHAAGAAIVVLPELADTGYVFEARDELEQLAGAIPEGRAAQVLIALARSLGVYIVSGLAERAGDVFYNSAIICGPEGYLGTFRKLHLWNRENLFFARGDKGLPVFETAFGKIGVAICYDGWFPETFRGLALKGATLVCVPTNWVPMPGNEAYPEAMANILHKAAAHSNGIYIACADRVGTERGQPFLGQSLIVGTKGWPLAGPASTREPEMLIADIYPDNVAANRSLSEFNDVLGDRRSDIYG